ncbi:Elongation factor P--(R)-beta-lysine ligase [Enhygromyxa salina]|uniref:Elongation factor P--(R)-beta-lysine ligase n=1 Tax=Enhygromyxa salina TaxID=215803 RepID=A0A2S9XAP8_9BACT|nr:amino acid--tRNA ligase-related protein [Enhygromyxa salina]PRP89934.1 Elongation factor P--(R)-beta-lysine ligase [Enhygromyxa salina]
MRVWDAALAAVRAQLRGAGLREVSTAIRTDAVAIEPWIEPISSAGKLLATSPELAMKRLLCRGAGSLFQIAHVFRAAEVGARHSEEFHLIEWYRDQGREEAGVEEGVAPVIGDVEQIVAAVFEGVAPLIADHGGVEPPEPPRRWRRVDLVELMGESLGQPLAGSEPADAIGALLGRVREAAGVRLGPGERPPRAPEDPELARLLAWTELFSLWSDVHLDPWLAALEPGVGVHVVGFPVSLAALAEREPDSCRAARFESHVAGVELANGYRELRDPTEQRARFELVSAMRSVHGQPALPMPEAFIGELDQLPPCAGAALGLDRLVALACGCERLDQVALL